MIIDIQNKILEYQNWQDLKSKLINISSNRKERGAIFEVITKYYLLINPIYKTKLKKVWLSNEVPIEIKKYLNLPDNGKGIDLIAQTKNNEYWSIQCKYRLNENRSINHNDIATFLDISDNICKNINHKLVCSTTNRQSYKSNKLYDDKIIFLLANTWNSLDENFFNQFRLLVENKAIHIKPFKPRKYQARAIKNADNYFKKENNTRGKLIMACGSGKSLTAYWIAQKLQSKTILIVVSTLASIKQALEVWTRESIANNIDINWLAVCIDDTISQNIFISSTKELGIDVSTDIDYISNWLQNKTNINIVFTTYQSGKIISQASQKANITYDLAIIDEAHKTIGLKDSLFSHLLFDENISISKRLFMTATARAYKENSDDVADMDDIELYGEDFEVLTFKETLGNNPPILCDYKIIAMMITEKEITEVIKNNNFVKPRNKNYTQEIKVEMLASTVALYKAINKYNIKHTISFHSSVEKAKIFKIQERVFRKSFKGYTDLDTFHISRETPMTIKNGVIDTFSKAGNALITNAECLTDGVDISNIDCVLFADYPRQDTIDILQAVKQVLRLAKDKKFGYVLVPILIDENIGINDIKNKNFITILRALASNDNRIIDYFQNINNNRSIINKSLIDFNIPIRTNRRTFNNAIKLSINSKLKKLKWKPFKEAREFVRSLNLNNIKEWELYCQNEFNDKRKKPSNIPSNPNHIYKLDGWNSMKDWLGTTNNLKYLPFEEARDFVKNLKLENQDEWKLYCQNKLKDKGKKPSNIPYNPNYIYKSDGWDGFKDWLGIEYLSFEEARNFARKLKLKNVKEWNLYCKYKLNGYNNKPANIPNNPQNAYKLDGWRGFKDWLRDNNNRYLSFEKARDFARNLGLKAVKDWKKYCIGEMEGLSPIPDNIPKSPEQVYRRDGFINFKDWLSQGMISFSDAKEFVKTLNLTHSREWNAYCKGEMPHLPTKPHNIPRDPDLRYRKNWINWNDWLSSDGMRIFGVENQRNFKEAREFVRNLKLSKQVEWKQYCKGELEGYPPKPKDIPATPGNIYKNHGWVNTADWLGTSRKRRPNNNSNNDTTWLPYEKARLFVRSLNLKDSAEWQKYIRNELENLPKKPNNIPNVPNFVYRKNDWINWNDWLGNDRTTKIRVKDALSFEEARKFVRSLGLKKTYEWDDYKKGKLTHLKPMPNNIPKAPNTFYKNKGWKGMLDWLGITFNSRRRRKKF